MAARDAGKLIVTDDGCLRLNYPGPHLGSLLIWPPDYSLDTEGNHVRIINENGQVAAEVGDYVEVGGGGLTSLNVELIPETLRQKLPERCRPPYHAVGFEVNVLRE